MSLENAILREVSKMVKTDKGFKNDVLDMLKGEGVVPQTKRLKVSVRRQKAIEVENSHFLLEKVIKTVSAGVNLALVGPAGSGKTSMVKQAADALKLNFYSQSVSQQTGVHEFFGYYDANGNYVSTLFRKAYQKGGVFLLDEFDAGNPNVLAALNQATANGECAFPDGMVKKHAKFIVVMAGNTYGTGFNAEYVGRNKIDAATLDRFYFMEVPYDETLERILGSNKDWVEKVQQMRKNAEKAKVKCIISPRASIFGSQLLESGLSEVDVAEGLVFKGLSPDEIDLVRQDVPLSDTSVTSDDADDSSDDDSDDDSAA